MADNKGLTKAKAGKKDEFFTQLSDIENELKYYKAHFQGKTVLCNCDDPRVSNFFRYFALNFKKLGLKKLITTCYKNQNPDLFSDYSTEQAVYLIYDGSLDIKTLQNLDEIPVEPLTGNGSYDSPECVKLLEESDIVVTNPPFSLFREYVAQLIKYDKKFLIIGNVNAITYKEIFPLIMANKLWLGASIHSGDRKFNVPDDYPLTAAGCGIDSDGKKYIRVKGVRWFTNLDYKERHEELILYRSYNPDDYPKFDNYDAINVDKTSDIPFDYDGVMGVPITFMDKYNPDQFEIVAFRKGVDGKDLVYSYTADNQQITPPDSARFNHTSEFSYEELRNPAINERPYINGKRMYARILIRYSDSRVNKKC
jgi:hypothetical protein